MAEIVLVHGIGQEDKDAACLLEDWTAALTDGLVAAREFSDVISLIRARRVSVGLVYYGDLFRKRDAQGGEAMDLKNGVPPAEVWDWAGQLGREWLERAAFRSSDDEARREARSVLADLDVENKEPMGGRSVLREIVAGMARIPWFARPTFAVAEHVAWRGLRQVTAYMRDVGGTRQEVLRRVDGVVDSSTRVLIGHSLGSVVAYEASHRLVARCPLLITLGSPLGLETVVFGRLVPQPPCYPALVDRWVNVADLDDLVAADPNLRPRFQPQGDGRLESVLVTNVSPHDATDYLGTPEVGRPVGEILIAGAL